MVTALSIILAVPTILFASFGLVTALSAILAVVTASSAILAVVTAPLANLVVLTVPSLGVPIFTVDPIVMMKKSALLEGSELNIISAPSIANPSLG